MQYNSTVLKQSSSYTKEQILIFSMLLNLLSDISTGSCTNTPPETTSFKLKILELNQI